MVKTNSGSEPLFSITDPGPAFSKYGYESGSATLLPRLQFQCKLNSRPQQYRDIYFPFRFGMETKKIKIKTESMVKEKRWGV